MHPRAKRRVTPRVTRYAQRPSTPAFSRLFEWLDNGVDSEGKTYLEMRRRLVSYFGRRHRLAAEDLADETLDRIAATLQRDGAITITPPAKYCYAVARFVLLEDFRREHKQIRLDERSSTRHLMTASASSIEPAESIEIREQRLECLERHLQELSPEQRALVIEYYRDAGRQRIEHRREIAKQLGVTMNALSIRVSRIRSGLEASVERCRKSADGP